jgi:hypothetical protein
MKTSVRNSRLAKIFFSALLLSAAILDGCGGGARYVTVQVPPEVNLLGYETIGVIEVGSNADGAINRYATERFQSTIQSAQPGTRLVELGSMESVLGAVGARELDADAVRRIGTRYRVAAVFEGQITYTEPKVNLGGITDLRSAQGNATVQMRGEMFAKLIETRTGASVWSNSSWATRQVGGVSVSRDRIAGSVQSSDPRHEMVGTLVHEVTTGLRESTARQRVN